MLKVVIVDDEQKAIESLIWELSNFEDKVEVVRTFTKSTEALEYLKRNKIDCLFLDIEMPTIDGFQFLDKLVDRNFAVVITTAYSEYAIKALKKEAVDYLLKPVDGDDLKLCLDKVKKVSTEKPERNLEFEKTLISFNERFNSKKIILNTDGKLIFVDPNEVLYVESDGNYSSIFIDKEKKIVVTKKLKEIDMLLPNNSFFRIHNSYIINLNKVKEYIKTDGYVVLEDNINLPVSRQRKSDFLDKF